MIPNDTFCEVCILLVLPAKQGDLVTSTVIAKAGNLTNAGRVLRTAAQRAFMSV
jgi:hypothetical protein